MDLFHNPQYALEFSFAWRLLAAVVLGALLGLERSLSGKHAGMRTYAMVSLGSAAFTISSIVASFEFGAFPGINPLQIASSVVVGIGFIGSGLALFHGERQIELTTASGVWVVASVGMACGFGLYITALTATVLSLLVFSVFSRIERRLRTRWGTPEVQ